MSRDAPAARVPTAEDGLRTATHARSIKALYGDEDDAGDDAEGGNDGDG